MTTTREPDPARTTPQNEPLLLVALCDGQCCRAVRALADDRSPGLPTSRSMIGDAVRTTSNSIMLATGCLGPCAQGAVVAIGAATLKNRALAWLSVPTYWGSTEMAQRAAALSRCIKAADVVGQTDVAALTGPPRAAITESPTS